MPSSSGDDASSPDSQPGLLSALQGRIRFWLAQPVDFQDTGSEATLAKVRLLTSTAIYFNMLALSDFGGRSGPEREEGLVEQVVTAAFQTFGGVDPHPDPFDKAAMLFRGITQGHPFNDGNKRTGFLIAAYYLHRTGFPLGRKVDESDIIRLCMRLSAGDLRDVPEISWELATCGAVRIVVAIDVGATEAQVANFRARA